jgi:hypothetical protein
MADESDKIGKALGVEPYVETASQVEKMLIDAHSDTAKGDFDRARANVYEVMNNGKEAIDRLMEIAEQSQHPRAYEVLATMMSLMVGASRELLSLQERIRKINNVDSPVSSVKSITHNNSIFVGSTSDLQRLITDMRKNQ